MAEKQSSSYLQAEFGAVLNTHTPKISAIQAAKTEKKI